MINTSEVMPTQSFSLEITDHTSSDLSAMALDAYTVSTPPLPFDKETMNRI